MRITRIEPIHVSIPFEHGAPKPARGMGAGGAMGILFVRVETDEGIVGWGEAFGFGAIPVTVAALARIVAPLATGRDATDIAALMTSLWRATQGMSRNGPVAYALSGLDIALWDIAGKAAGAPVWQLLGGKGKARIPAYASLMRTDDPKHVASMATAAAERGYRQIKLHEHTVDTVAAARGAVGPGVALMVDTNCTWPTVEEACAVARAMQPHDLTWLEEPLFPPDDFDGLARLRREAGVPIAAGENLGSVNDVRRIVEAGAVDVVQPSISKMGGVSEIKKAVDYAASRGARLVPHSPFSGPALIAVLHVIAAMPGEVFCEHRYCDLAANPFADWDAGRDGQLSVPQKRGLGIELDAKVIARFRVE